MQEQKGKSEDMIEQARSKISFCIFEGVDHLPMAIELKEVIAVKCVASGGVILNTNTTAYHVLADYLDIIEAIRKAKGQK